MGLWEIGQELMSGRTPSTPTTNDTSLLEADTAVIPIAIPIKKRRKKAEA